MRLHREGKKHLIIIAVVCLIAIFVTISLDKTVGFIVAAVLAIFYLLVLNFFRNPNREIRRRDDKLVYAPADGKVVVIENVFEAEYFQSKRIQVSIFMSPLNVHLNRVPISGKVRYKKYYAGKYLVAWHPKSSQENERTSVVIQNTFGEILIKQIAGAVARRISNYLETGDEVIQGEELGFIKFGSRVDILLPIDSEIRVNLGDVVRGNVDVIGVMG